MMVKLYEKSESAFHLIGANTLCWDWKINCTLSSEPQTWKLHVFLSKTTAQTCLYAFSSIIFPRSTNFIIDFWRRRCFPCWIYRVMAGNGEFKKLRRLLQRKRHIKIEFCVRLSVLRLLQVDHVARNRRSVISLSWHEWFSCEGKEWKIYCCSLALSSEPQIWKLHSVIWQTTSKRCTKKRAAWAARLFSFINQLSHWFVAFSSSFLNLPS